jgi:hypothetical protein
LPTDGKWVMIRAAVRNQAGALLHDIISKRC